MNIFELQNYRRGFRKIFEREKKAGSRSLAALAKSVRMQPSYLTNVTHERAHFSSDQIYALAEKLSLSEEEADFLNLLMEHERASHEGRRRRLAAEIEKERKRNLRAEKVISAKETSLGVEAKERYYLDPNVELLHLFLGTLNAPAKIPEIARQWGLPDSYVAEVIAFLQKENLVKLKGGRWQRERISQHLPRESPLTRPQQLLKRVKALDTIQKLPQDAAYSFSASVTMNEEARLSIQAKFLEFLKACQSAVENSQPEGVYQIQFDLFPWVR